MRQRWANWSLRVQLSFAVMLIMVLLLVLFSGVLFLAVRSFVLDQSAEQLRARARVLLGDLATAPATINTLPWQRTPTGSLSTAQREALQAVVDALTTDDTSAVVYQPDGSAVVRGTPPVAQPRFGRSFGPPRTPSSPPNPASLDNWVLERVLRGDSSISYTTTHRGFDQQLAVLVPVYDETQLIGVVQVTTPLQQTYVLLRWLGAALVGGTLLVGLTAFLLSLWATRMILHPLRRVVATSQRVGAGDLSARTALRSHNEIGVLGTTFDQMVAQLQATFAAQRRFVADAAHELRTPLTAVSGNVEMLMLGAVSDPAQQRRSLQRMNSELERMGRLVDDLLTLSRLDGRPSLQRSAVDMSALALDLIQSFRDRVPDHQWQATTMPHVVVLGDPDRLRQVLLNVLENAHKYTPQGGTIEVKVAARDGAAVITVADTGVGIPAEDVAHVWDRFYRVDAARSRDRGGAGLGLAIVKSIVEAHNGQVALQSASGVGTTVTLTLPLAHGQIDHNRFATQPLVDHSSAERHDQPRPQARP